MLIIGGDKTGNPRFYDEMIPIAERLWKQYLLERQAAPDPPGPRGIAPRKGSRKE